MSASSVQDDPFGNYEDATEVGVGFSDEALLAVSVVGFAAMAFLIYSIIITRVKSYDELEKGGIAGGEDGELDYEEELLRADVSTLNRAQRRLRAKALMKRERRIAAADGDGGEENNNGEGEGAAEDQQPHLSRKERQRAAKATEKKERHLLDEKRREEQRHAMEVAKQEKKKRQELEAERIKEEKRQRQIDEEQKKQQEFDDWNIFLSSPNDGSVSISVEQWAKELEDLQSPIVPLKELCMRFDVPLDKVKTRISELVSAGRITGVLDEERETFFVFTHDSLLSLASYIKNMGEVSLDDISNKAKDLLVPPKSC